MNIRRGHLILYLSVIGFAVAVDFPPAVSRVSSQRSKPFRGEMKRSQKLVPKQAILQSVGKRSHAQGGLIPLSEELEMVAAVDPIVAEVAAGKTKSKNSSDRSMSPVTNESPTNTSIPAIATTESDMFRSYMETHRKKYYAKYRAQRRRSAYLDNLEEIKQHNKAFEKGSNRFRMAPNAFADMNNSEYRKRLIRLKMDPHRKVKSDISDEIVSSSNELPESIDWREKGFKTGPANQKTCGSCYAFSVAYAISAQLMKHIGRVEMVSEQQMVDCSTATGNLGCGGGSLRNTLKYLEQAGGVMREVDYPYTSSVSLDERKRCKMCGNCEYDTPYNTAIIDRVSRRRNQLSISFVIACQNHCRLEVLQDKQG
ncbi:cathepsin L2-like [Anopheles maculipalpis]|uniref:cathepsin L2-like n=1 Tax=Anopheles maculipalpis TaxID=1496333 RepID=UPI0021597263|nr:cathepsin L2-like [Anopheles maculipalpis]